MTKKKMEQIKDFRELEVWQVAHAVTLKIYRITRTFPDDEKYGIVSQMRRSTYSVSANIVEGFRRRGRKEKSHFYSIGQASADELLYFLILSKDLGYIKDMSEEEKQLNSIVKMLATMIKRLGE